MEADVKKRIIETIKGYARYKGITDSQALEDEHIQHYLRANKVEVIYAPYCIQNPIMIFPEGFRKSLDKEFY